MLKSYIKIISLLALLLAFPAWGFSAETESADKEIVPIHIEADKMVTIGNKSIITGNVVVVRGDMTMKSDEMEVTAAEGNQVKEIYSKGNVRIEDKDLLALSGFARLYQDEQKVVLTDNAKVWKGDNYIEGEKITLFMESNRLFVDKGDNKGDRIKIIITPQKENE
ncbi:lipopolysaccharide transport periplasmic protein LptA [Denitrovibrio acetiphilus DSM 12809]|uniref:Lipopolysaccharide transport periplasmic protein LptA n=1 Tax=Denitrovibrio acetiphilus (strain DSM 12809 / NBRC 114555 / N2460) TaxID=522772 RepID=D4H7T0_DENA2|nr:lipopolysaccharide transport periplasmic protein LptA [Denitrovibrio acetiphilus]ADD68079.1 lipopolysaccharide transport periplasmic protein LptA [Denitrovibrio acetiphilus DSM 12809]